MSQAQTWSRERLTQLVAAMTPAQKIELDRLLGFPVPIWSPHLKNIPQQMAYASTADVVGFGGAAGGGKTDLAIGKALTQHRQVAIFRREGTEMSGIVDRMKEIVGHDNGYVGSGRWWGWNNPVPGVQIEFGSVPNLGDETKFQGRPKDLLVLDEAANFLEQQVRFLKGWVRTTNPKQPCQTLLCFNPPTSSEGRWIIDFFAPWLDPKHPCPAAPGELRWFAMLDGKETEVPTGEPFMHNCEEIRPQSRTFIPARVVDNPYLMGTNYMTELQALPEPLRSQMLYGDFQAGMSEDAMQVIPTAWVEAAMVRWKPRMPKPRMDSLGIDVARGGKDNTIIARRHGWWFDEPLVYPGKETPDGPTVAGLAIAAMRDNAPMHIDAIGVGASPYDFLSQANQQVIGVIVAEGSGAKDRSGRLGFANLRSELWWKMREALDPNANNGVELPPDKRLLADLTSPRWKPRGAAILVESREDLLDPKRLGRSPDWASAYILALMDTPRVSDLPGALNNQTRGHDPYAMLDQGQQVVVDHDPYAEPR